MENILIVGAVLVIIALLTQCLSKEKNPPGGSCRDCPEYRYCGGGRPRCVRRSGTIKKE